MAIFASTGFGDRLLSEVKKLAPKDVKIKVRREPLGRWVLGREVGPLLSLSYPAPCLYSWPQPWV